MDRSTTFLKTKSHRILNVVEKELKKISPIGASNRHLSKDPNLPKGAAENIAKRIMKLNEKKKYTNSPLLSYIETRFKIDDVHMRTPHSSDNKRSTLSPVFHFSPTIRTPEKSPEIIRKASLQKMMSIKEEPEGKKNFQNMLTVNSIIEACDQTSNAKDKVIPYVLKSFTRQMTILANHVDKVISKSRGTSDE